MPAMKECVQVNFRLTKEQQEVMDRYCKTLGRSKVDLFRSFLISLENTALDLNGNAPLAAPDPTWDYAVAWESLSRLKNRVGRIIRAIAEIEKSTTASNAFLMELTESLETEIDNFKCCFTPTNRP